MKWLYNFKKCSTKEDKSQGLSFFLYIRGNYKLMNAMKTVSKSLLLTFLSALSLLSGCKIGEDNSRFYRENLEKIIVDENIPLKQ